MAFLILENGMVFEGEQIGFSEDVIGELVFTTGMEGYIETLTDPSYYGQIVIQTFPLIGNYGFINEDREGKPSLFGYVLREECETPSNFRCDMTLDKFLKEERIPGIKGVNTRELTRILREEGTMNAMIASNVPEDLSEIENYIVRDAVKNVTTPNTLTFVPNGDIRFRIALIDYGAKMNIIRSLTKRGCEVHVYNAFTKASEILNGGYDGIMLSNGPGDPKEATYSIEQIKLLIGKLPIFGICLGHQLTALALGGNTEKLKFGHRGANQPVKSLETGRTYITSQNHGYAVISDSLKGVGVESFVNANDGSNEGMKYDNLKCFTTQFHPEACSGPKDTDFLFDDFIELIEKEKQNA